MTDFPRRRKEDSFFGRVFAFIRRFFVVIGIAATISVIALVSTLDKLVHYVPPSLPDSMILTYTFKPGLTEDITKPSLTQPPLSAPGSCGA